MMTKTVTHKRRTGNMKRTKKDRRYFNMETEEDRRKYTRRVGGERRTNNEKK